MLTSWDEYAKHEKLLVALDMTSTGHGPLWIWVGQGSLNDTWTLKGRGFLSGLLDCILPSPPPSPPQHPSWQYYIDNLKVLHPFPLPSIAARLGDI